MLSTGLKHANRYRKIATVLARHGFGYVLHEVGLFHVLSLPKRLSTNPKDPNYRLIGERICNVLEELGPTFIKLGQMISTRKDLFPPFIVEELEKLQDDVPSFEYKQVKKIVEEEMQCPIEEAFNNFHPEPLAAASIGQVHQAELHDGTMVAVKVARPHIKEIIEKDLDILHDLTRLLSQRFQWARYYRLEEIADEFSDAIRNEADYTLELRNTEKMHINMQKFNYIEIPEVFREYSTRKMITMSYIQGDKLSKWEENHDGHSPYLARELADAFLHQILIDGFFHSDPHPGNFLITGKNKLCLLDFGQIGRLNRTMRNEFITYVISMTKRDPEEVARTIYNMADVPDDVDFEEFIEEVDFLLDKYYQRPFQEVRVGEAINDIFSASHRYNILIYKEYTLLAKAVITIESILAKLDPSLSIVEIAEPYGRLLARERLNPKKWSKKWWREAQKQGDTLLKLPESMRAALDKVNSEELSIGVRAPKINIFLNKLDRISNRISFSVTVLAFAIIMVGLIIGSTFGDSSSILVQLPVIEISFIVSFFMFLLLIFSIFRSGRF
ncbi:ubiquinone biosynthesis protein [Geomicrobium halophilum]|uniref:Ubiquinone biosynthesis protein n=1 Tax=Geomicrobium halophilum TaxID=549000 RepID=A0A841Q0P3_9BACL|nr:AarF/ABC1/UbiB kinase family protein [Geomicrobium halophilum]MBB6449078.1 ubiquinone biosynthesis protein [Geomicrobium halophilum]